MKIEYPVEDEHRAVIIQVEGQVAVESYDEAYDWFDTMAKRG